MTARKRARLPAAQRKAQIVDAALQLAAVTGPGGVTAELLAAHIGISQPAVFRHFPRKEMIWSAVAGRIGEEMAEAWNRAESDGTPQDRLRALVLAHLAYIEKTPGLIAILFSRELHTDNATLRAGLAENHKQLQSRLIACLRDGLEQGRFRGGLDAKDGAQLVIAVIQSLALRWSLSGRGFALRDEGARLLDVLIAGFLPNPT